ncbi:uncharacterized protein LOC131248716 isoform X2 [Magnolia sinica]|uniref:uncharacterized protein LOC131248716 isoform X2 n=1 Tax=Magnolia sinica TaxID=86752 RepID=UPI002659C740|nr:uncharacterized protein LOC131248716 isoform X2 [Magnolia sinica]
MQNDGPEGKGALDRESVVCSDIEKQENSSREEDGCASSSGESVDKDVSAVAVASIAIVISRADACDQSSAVLDVMGNGSKLTGGLEKDGRADGVAAMAPKKGFLVRIESYHEQCRVCQQQSEETLMDLGCQCRGELAKAHRSCIELWFRTRGSNKCEICQQVAANVPNQESQPTSSYWIWRVDPALGGSNSVETEQERGCFSPLWVAFSILIGGLLLDVLISISLGVSALPVNIIIGVLVVLGLGTALRLALECCHEWSLRRSIRRADTDINPGYHPAV